MKCRRFRHVLFPVLVLLGGCQQLNQAKPLLSHAPIAAEKSSPLRPAQVADIQIGMGRSLEARGETSQAMAAYSEALAKDPSRADAYVRLAVLADGLGKFTDAGQWYHKALKLQPDNPNTLCNLGYSFYLQRQWEEAETNLRRAISLAPDHQRAHNNLGLVLAHTDRADEALVEFRKAGCNRAGAEVNLAFVLALEGTWSEAQNHYQLALKEDPSSVPASKGLQEVRALIAKAGSTGLQLTRRTEPIPPVPSLGGERKTIQARGMAADDTTEWTPRPSGLTANRVEINHPNRTPPIPIWIASPAGGGPTPVAPSSQ
jgi:Tfp pilus assembly protein PilF